MTASPCSLPPSVRFYLGGVNGDVHHARREPNLNPQFRTPRRERPLQVDAVKAPEGGTVAFCHGSLEVFFPGEDLRAVVAVDCERLWHRGEGPEGFEDAPF